MNLTLKEVVQTNPEGDRFFRLPEVYVRGNNVCIFVGLSEDRTFLQFRSSVLGEWIEKDANRLYHSDKIPTSTRRSRRFSQRTTTEPTIEPRPWWRHGRATGRFRTRRPWRPGTRWQGTWKRQGLIWEFRIMDIKRFTLEIHSWSASSYVTNYRLELRCYGILRWLAWSDLLRFDKCWDPSFPDTTGNEAAPLHL